MEAHYLRLDSALENVEDVKEVKLTQTDLKLEIQLLEGQEYKRSLHPLSLKRKQFLSLHQHVILPIFNHQRKGTTSKVTASTSELPDLNMSH